MQTDVLLVAHAAGIPIQPGQYPLLVTLEEQGPMAIGALARAMQMSQPAITKNANRLARSGLVTIDRGETDRRQSTVALSPAGQQALDRSKRKVWPLVEAAVREVLQGLSGSFLDQVAMIEERMEARSLNARARAHAVASLQVAVDADVPGIVTLMNRAYRGTGTGSGWNSEADYMSGDRTSEALLREEIVARPDAVLLAWRMAEDVQGCVWLQPLADDAWYLGSLTVDPRLQNVGLGRQLLTAAEQWVRDRGGRSIRMTVVNVRDSLIAWYERRGYEPTGEIEPFPYEDARFGVPNRDDLKFVVMQKHLH
ncbi:GNAT family N-acetyltransferase [Lichenicola sp.]|uniref:GNAT family N-acetyltransferase n=1 Tax=Lichenicola sp. TaxID=2804529 RepID=UPI003B000173